MNNISYDDVYGIVKDSIRREAVFHEEEIDTKSINKEMGVDVHALSDAVDSSISEIESRYGISFGDGKYATDLDAGRYYNKSTIFNVISWFIPYTDDGNRDGKESLYLKDVVTSIWRAIPDGRKLVGRDSID